MGFRYREDLTGDAKCALKASYLVARRVAQSKKAFTIAEVLVLPAAVDMCREMTGEAAAKKLKTIPLSNDSLDESTDVTNTALLLLVFVRYRWDSSTVLWRATNSSYS